MKRCFRCKEEKDISEFYLHPQMADGHLGKCKDCAKIDARSVRLAKKEYYDRYDSMRAKLPHRRKALRDYAVSHPEVVRKCRQKWNAANRVKKTAHSKLRRALKSGKIERKPCERCGSWNSHAHHDDYSLPLSVRWLCPLHHMEVHRKHKL